MGAIPTAVPLGFNPTDLDNVTHGFPHEVFVAHRREAPVPWHEPTEHTLDGEGFWSVATHAETRAGGPEWTRSNEHAGLRRVPLRLRRPTARS